MQGFVFLSDKTEYKLFALFAIEAEKIVGLISSFRDNAVRILA